MRFHVAVDGESRGYVCEVYDAHFRLPDLGPIGECDVRVRPLSRLFHPECVNSFTLRVGWRSLVCKLATLCDILLSNLLHAGPFVLH